MDVNVGSTILVPKYRQAKQYMASLAILYSNHLYLLKYDALKLWFCEPNLLKGY